MAWTKEQHAAAYAEKRKDPDWYEAHKAKSLASYHRRSKKAAIVSKNYHENNKTKRCASARKWQNDNPDKVKISKERACAKMYGLTASQLRTARQAVSCEICDTVFTDTKTKHVDHNHATGKYRGMLCHHCNLGLGRFKDNPELLINAAKYLMKHAK